MEICISCYNCGHQTIVTVGYPTDIKCPVCGKDRDNAYFYLLGRDKEVTISNSWLLKNINKIIKEAAL